MTRDELVRSLDTPNKAEWRATVHQLMTALPATRTALLAGLLSERPLVRVGCAAALHGTDHGDFVAALRKDVDRHASLAPTAALRPRRRRPAQ